MEEEKATLLVQASSWGRNEYLLQKNGSVRGREGSVSVDGISFLLSQGLQWVKLTPEEIPSRIQAITGKRGRPRNTEKAKAKEMPKVKRGRGRPPKVKVPDLLSKTDARVLKKLEAQGTNLVTSFLHACSLHKEKF